MNRVEKDLESVAVFSFSQEDLIFVTPSTQNKTAYGNRMSKFDNILQEKWNYASEHGSTRYQLTDIESKCLKGKYNFLCQMNEKRATNRRAPQTVSNIVMDFNPNDFNFNKVPVNEVLLCMTPSWSKNGRDHFILINASPFEYGNSLLVPRLKDCMPQVLNEEGLHLLIETVLLSANPYFRAGFNSLTAMASVNHFHFHVYYLNHRMYLETAKTRKLHKNCFEIVDYPGQGFVFQIIKLQDIEEVCSSLMQLVTYFLKNSVAHNVFVTRGSAFQDTSAVDYNALRVYVWAREPVLGQKPTTSSIVYLIPACIELAGHLPIKNKELYERICEKDVALSLREASATKFEEVKSDINYIFNSI